MKFKELGDNNNLRSLLIEKGAFNIFIILIILIVTTLSSYSIIKYKKTKNTLLLSSSSMLGENTSQNNLNNLSKLMWLPKESKPPRIFEITDPKLLSNDQPFYAGSNVGDILIIFDESKKAIIYSPKRNIIINTGTFVYKNDDEKLLNQ